LLLLHFSAYLPTSARELRLVQEESQYYQDILLLDQSFGDNNAFYYRFHSPVIIVELDHHSGVLLTNEEPTRFHIHTILRTPHGGNYEMALRPLVAGTTQDFVWGSENVLNQYLIPPR
jgi:hypothetical protein